MLAPPQPDRYTLDVSELGEFTQPGALAYDDLCTLDETAEVGTVFSLEDAHTIVRLNRDEGHL